MLFFLDLGKKTTRRLVTVPGAMSHDKASLLRVPNNIVGAHVRLEYGKLTLPKRRVRQRWDAAGAPT